MFGDGVVGFFREDSLWCMTLSVIFFDFEFWICVKVASRHRAVEQHNIGNENGILEIQFGGSGVYWVMGVVGLEMICDEYFLFLGPFHKMAHKTCLAWAQSSKSSEKLGLTLKKPLRMTFGFPKAAMVTLRTDLCFCPSLVGFAKKTGSMTRIRGGLLR